MRLQLRRRRATARALALAATAAALLGAAAPAGAQESTLRLRGNYWRDRNTRVLAPEASLTKSFATGTTVEASYMLDAITSASASAGVLADQPFTELRSDVGFRVAQRFGPATVNLKYRYSTESDYWSNSIGGGVALELFQKNLTLSLNYNNTSAVAARRVSAVGYVWANGTKDQSSLTTHFANLGVTQVLGKGALLEAGYELSVLDGFQANPYRSVKISGSPVRETVPLFRVRHTVTGGLRWTPVYRAGPVHYLTVHGRALVYADSWGMSAMAPELRTYLALGPVELRLTGRYMAQKQADFYRSNQQDMAEYSAAVLYDHCPLAPGDVGTMGHCATGDSKLSSFHSTFVEGRVLLSLSVLDQPWMPLGKWLGRGWIAASAGRYWNSGFANAQYGDAWVGGLELETPL